MQPLKVQEEIDINIGKNRLTGNLVVPEGAKALVIFSHGSGSSRFSPRNRFVASSLQERKIGTLLIDLLTPEEDQVYHNRFDIELLTNRLIAVTKNLMYEDNVQGLNLGYFGASTGAASALGAAARIGSGIKAVVSRGGRPDLAITLLPEVHAATLFIVGSLDKEVITLNQKAYEVLKTRKELSIISGAGHLFEEAGKLEEVARIAGDWFEEYLISG